jgi:hypothetical protein
MQLQHNNAIFNTIKELIAQSRQRVYRMANATLLETYWNIGKLIVEDEQHENSKAEYGKATLKNLATLLTLEFGKGFDDSNLRNMRLFYFAFPVRDALRHELSWTHYRLVSRLDTEIKRNYYVNEAIVKYSVLNDKNNLFASKYALYLPKVEELKQLIEEDRLRFELDNN